jgi:hypothetical protein
LPIEQVYQDAFAVMAHLRRKPVAAIGDGVKPAVGAYAQSGNAAELWMSRSEFESAQQD